MDTKDKMVDKRARSLIFLTVCGLPLLVCCNKELITHQGAYQVKAVHKKNADPNICLFEKVAVRNYNFLIRPNRY